MAPITATEAIYPSILIMLRTKEAIPGPECLKTVGETSEVMGLKNELSSVVDWCNSWGSIVDLSSKRFHDTNTFPYLLVKIKDCYYFLS
ncbi:hypothetical protein D3C76_1188420 [compost metagenome]